MTIFIQLGAVIAFLFWFDELAQLMSMNDDDFPGDRDKVMWFALFLGSFLLAAGYYAWLAWTDLVGWLAYLTPLVVLMTPPCALWFATWRRASAVEDRLAKDLGAIIQDAAQNKQDGAEDETED